ncbi:MAG: hypothetical protein HRU19_25960 [Pseudobacteriovorax sp.]|nr:hypothetical protein [Pseudobacteriovorax sp.]
MKNLSTCLLFAVISVPIHGANITSNEAFQENGGSVIEPLAIEENQKEFEFLFDRFENVRIFPDNSELTGDINRLRGSFHFGLSHAITLGTSLTLTDQTNITNRDFFKDQSLDANLGLHGKLVLLRSDSYAFTIIPFFETGLSDKSSYASNSKSKLGVVLSGMYDFTWLELITNAHLRFRPAAIHDIYRIANDQGFGFKLAKTFDQIRLWSEFFQSDRKFLNVNRASDRYRVVSTQKLGLGASWIMDRHRFEVQYGKPLSTETIGLGHGTISVGYSFLLDSPAQAESDSEVLSPDEKIKLLDELRENLTTEKSHSEKLVNQLSFQQNNRVRPETQRSSYSIERADKAIETLIDVEKRVRQKEKNKTSAGKKVEPKVLLPEPSSGLSN